MPTEQSPRLSLPYIAPQQAQKHVTHNEAIRRLDALTQINVKDRDLATPPGFPSEGDAYIAAAGASGDWAGGDQDLFAFQDGAWVRYQPAQGMAAWAADEGVLVVWTGTFWQTVNAGGGGGGGDGTFNTLGVNATANATNKLLVKSNAALFDSVDVGEGGDGDMRFTINKEAVGDTASYLFTTGHSGRAECGLAGDDDFHFKVSADGAAWRDAIIVDKDNGYVGLGGQPPQSPLSVHPNGSARPSISAGTVGYIARTSGAGAFAAFSIISGNASTSRIFFGDTDSETVGRIDYNHTINEMEFWTNSSLKMTVEQGLVVGSPAGGDKGAGTINAKAVYDDNALLSCYVFDQAIDGAVDTAKWDAKVPDRKREGERGLDGARLSDDVVERRVHQPVRRFIAQVGGAYDPLSLDGYARHWKERRHLASLPDESTFDPAVGLSTGDWIQRLVETVEIQAVLIEELNQRVKGARRA
ncbi:MAG: DUF2793 domain-containing protein [Pseudomonadota bacterium]